VVVSRPVTKIVVDVDVVDGPCPGIPPGERSITSTPSVTRVG
jgi:hypothetical protein